MTEPPPERPAGTTVGPLAQEAAMLLDVVADRLEAMKKEPAAERGATGPAAAGSAAPADDQPAQGAGDPPIDNNTKSGSGVPAGAARCPECGSVPGGSCTACPLCRFMALLRGERPEATARLVDGALLIIRTLRSMVPEPAEPGTAARQHAHHDAANPPPARRTGLEHIDIQ